MQRDDGKNLNPPVEPKRTNDADNTAAAALIEAEILRVHNPKKSPRNEQHPLSLKDPDKITRDETPVKPVKPHAIKRSHYRQRSASSNLEGFLENFETNPTTPPEQTIVQPLPQEEKIILSDEEVAKMEQKLIDLKSPSASDLSQATAQKIWSDEPKGKAAIAEQIVQPKPLPEVEELRKCFVELDGPTPPTPPASKTIVRRGSLVVTPEDKDTLNKRLEGLANKQEPIKTTVVQQTNLTGKNYQSDALYLALNGDFKSPEEHLKALNKILGSENYRKKLEENDKIKKVKVDNLRSKRTKQITISDVKRKYRKLIDEVAYKHYQYAQQILDDLNLPYNFFSTANDKTSLFAESSYFNTMNYRVSGEILEQTSPQARAIVYEEWIAIMVRSFQLGNHTTVQALVGALVGVHLERLDIQISSHAKKILELMSELAGKPGKSHFFNLTLQRANNIKRADGLRQDYVTVPIQSLMGLIILGNEKLDKGKEEEWAFKYETLISLLLELNIINKNFKTACESYQELLTQAASEQKKEIDRKEIVNAVILEPIDPSVVSKSKMSDKDNNSNETNDGKVDVENKFKLFFQEMIKYDIFTQRVIDSVLKNNEDIRKQLAKCLFELEELRLRAENTKNINDSLIFTYKDLALKIFRIVRKTSPDERDQLKVEEVVTKHLKAIAENENQYKPTREFNRVTRLTYNVLIERLRDDFQRRLSHRPLFPVIERIRHTSAEINTELYNASYRIKPLKQPEKPAEAAQKDTIETETPKSIFVGPFKSIILSKKKADKICKVSYKIIRNYKAKDEAVTVLREYTILQLTSEQKEALAKEFITENGKEITKLIALRKIQKMLDDIIDAALTPNVRETYNLIRKFIEYITKNEKLYEMYIKYSKYTSKTNVESKSKLDMKAVVLDLAHVYKKLIKNLDSFAKDNDYFELDAYLQMRVMTQRPVQPPATPLLVNDEKKSEPEKQTRPDIDSPRPSKIRIEGRRSWQGHKSNRDVITEALRNQTSIDNDQNSKDVIIRKDGVAKEKGKKIEKEQLPTYLRLSLSQLHHSEPVNVRDNSSYATSPDQSSVSGNSSRFSSPRSPHEGASEAFQQSARSSTGSMKNPLSKLAGSTIGSTSTSAIRLPSPRDRQPTPHKHRHSKQGSQSGSDIIRLSSSSVTTFNASRKSSDPAPRIEQVVTGDRNPSPTQYLSSTVRVGNSYITELVPIAEANIPVASPARARSNSSPVELIKAPKTFSSMSVFNPLDKKEDKNIIQGKSPRTPQG